MRSKSHLYLGKYLVNNYLRENSSVYNAAFLFGCVQPDKNPVTYLKGSIRYQMLRGHNYPNSQRYIAKLSAHLERKRRYNLWDHYMLGKLIHYTADAFTFAHNQVFQENLARHKRYEADLQTYFLTFLSKNPRRPKKIHQSISEAIAVWHNEYTRHRAAFRTDSIYAFTVCCIIMATLSHRSNGEFPKIS